MHKHVMIVALFSLTLGALAIGQHVDPAEVALTAAAQRALRDGDLNGAIEQYRQIVTRYAANRAVVAKALVELGACYEKLGNAEARKAYERVVREFGDQTESVAAARTRLAAMQPAGAPPTQAARLIWTAGMSADPSESSPSVDGRFIGFTEWNTGDLGIRDLTTGTSRHLTNTGGWEASADFAEATVISPDSRQIAYGWYDNKLGRYELRVTATSGSEPAKILHRSDNTTYVFPAAWTPDGKQILMLRNLQDGTGQRTGQITLIAAQDGSVRVLKDLGEWRWPRRASLSPDGRYIAYDLQVSDKEPARDVFVLATDGSREVVAVKSPADDYAPMWSADGSQILFLSDRTRNISLWAVPFRDGAAAGPAELAKADIGSIWPLGVTRSGALYYGLGGARSNIHVAQLDSAGKVAKAPDLAVDRFIDSNLGPAWSPDGQFLAYYSLRGPRDVPGSTVVVVRTVKTGEERDIPLRFLVPPAAGSPRWFPDGKSLLVLSRQLRGGLGYQRLYLTTGQTEPLHSTATRGPGPAAPDLSPDGKTIVCIEQREQNSGPSKDQILPSRLLRVDLETRRVTELKRSSPNAAVEQYFTAVAISPDGQQLTYLFYDDATRSTSLHVMPLNGGESREVYRAAPWLDGSRFQALAWTPDQRYLLFVRGAPSGVASTAWRVRATGGDAEPLGVSMPAHIRMLGVHPDGRQLVFRSQVPGNLEMWALENFLPQRNTVR